MEMDTKRKREREREREKCIACSISFIIIIAAFFRSVDFAIGCCGFHDSKTFNARMRTNLKFAAFLEIHNGIRLTKAKNLNRIMCVVYFSP